MYLPKLMNFDQTNSYREFSLEEIQFTPNMKIKTMKYTLLSIIFTVLAMVISFMLMASFTEYSYVDSNAVEFNVATIQRNVTRNEVYYSIELLFQKLANHSKLPLCEYSTINNKTLHYSSFKFNVISQLPDSENSNDSNSHNNAKAIPAQSHEPSCQTRIPQIFHQIYKDTKLPSQYTFSVASIARNHLFSYDSDSLYSLNESSTKHLFQYYFWTDDSVIQFIQDAQSLDPIFHRFKPNRGGTLFSDFAYVW